MAYSVASLAPGDIVLVAGVHWTGGLWGGLLDAAIQWATVSPFHHAALVGDGVLIQALAQVETAALDTYAADGWAYRVAATPAQRTAAVAWAAAHQGAPYGTRELLLDAARFDLHWLPRARHLKHWTCSGFIFRSYLDAGVCLTYAPWPAPSDLSYSPLLGGPRPV